MTGSVRVRVSKWDLPEETRVSAQLENNQMINESKHHDNTLMSEKSSSQCSGGQISTIDIPRGDDIHGEFHSLVSEPVVALSKVDSGSSNHLKTSDVKMGEKDTVTWAPVLGIKTELDGDDSKAHDSNWTDGDFSGKDKSWCIPKEDKSDHKNDNDQRDNSGWGTSLGLVDNKIGSQDRGAWQRGIRNISPNIGARSSRNRSRSRSRSQSRSPTPGYRREENWNERNKFGSGFHREACKAFAAGRCSKGSQCRYMHEDGGKKSDRSNKPDAAGNREIYDRARTMVDDVKEYTRESTNARGSSEDRFSYGKRHRYEEDREHIDYRNKKSAVQCMDYARGKCQRGADCRYLHHVNLRDGEQHAKDSGREGVYDRGRTNSLSGHDSKHEYRRISNILCKFFPEGRCRNGDKCRFSHQGSVQDVEASKPDDEKRVTRGDSENRPMWNGPRRGDPVALNAQSNVTGWGNDSIHNSGTSHVPNTSTTGLPLQHSDSNHSKLSNEAPPIIYPIQKHNASTETSWQQQWHEMVPPSQNVGSTPVQQPPDVKREYFTHINTSMAVRTSSQNEVNVNKSTGEAQNVVSHVSRTELVSQNGQTEQIVPPVSLGSDPSRHSIQPNAPNDYFSSQASPRIQNSSSNSNYPPFGVQGQSVYPQTLIAMAKFPPTQPAATMPGSNANDSSQPTRGSGFAIPVGQDKLELKGGAEFSDGNNPNHKNAVTGEQMPQIANLSASLAQIFGNDQQLPQLYAALNPSAPGVAPMQTSSQPNNVTPVLSTAPAIQQHTVLWSQQHQNSTSSIMPSNLSGGILSSQVFSNLNEQTSARSLISSSHVSVPNNIVNHHGIAESEWKLNENKMIGTGGQNELGKSNEIPIDEGKKEVFMAPTNKGDKKDNDKDTKGIRMFKYALVEFIKEILKPLWKEGNMSKEVHKTIVKKVVDKVTDALQSNIPQTQERIDFYLEHSKEKLSKLVQAYVEKFAQI